MKSLALLAVLPLLLTACQTTRPPLKTVPSVDLPRYMGAWYVVGTIPWFVEKNNVGTMDIYELRPDGNIDVRYAFHKGSLDAPRKEWKALGRVTNPGVNSEWTVQFLWPFRAPFLIIDLAEDYSTTVVGHPSRDLVWIMSRTPEIPKAEYDRILSRLAAQGYDVSRIVRVPQRTGPGKS